MPSLDQNALEILFTKARTHYSWEKKDVDPALLQKIYDLAKMGPTSANSCPMRIVFVKSKEAKEKLKSCLEPANVNKTMTAPVTAIIAFDLEFYEHLPKLFPHMDARAWFVGKPKFIEETAFRNGTLQGAYFILAARACGLDCGPMSGFNRTQVDEVFFKGTSWKSNFLINLGYGDNPNAYPRSPRFEFDEVCRIL